MKIIDDDLAGSLNPNVDDASSTAAPPSCGLRAWPENRGA